jgi:hypothetical protein
MIELLAALHLESRARVAVMVILQRRRLRLRRLRCRGVEVGAMEAVSSFKYIEVFKKMNFIFAAVGSGGFGGGIEEEDEFLAPMDVLFFSLAYVQGSSYVRNFLFSFRLKFVATKPV